MRTTALALISAAVLAACNPSAPNSAASADTAAGVFPDLFQTSYRAEATISHEGQAVPVVMIRDGRKLRMEIRSLQGEMVMVANAETGEAFSIAQAGGRRMAMRMDMNQVRNPAEAWSAEIAAAAQLTGPCSGAGESGQEWTRQENGATHTACVTRDGIILKAAENGQVNWETTSVERGSQDAALFTLPPGVQVMDMGQAMAEAMEKMKAAQGR